ncbi:MAG: hypothetical protein R2792_01850 [Saprospiraceae bacterium]
MPDFFRISFNSHLKSLDFRFDEPIYPENTFMPHKFVGEYCIFLNEKIPSFNPFHGYILSFKVRMKDFSQSGFGVRRGFIIRNELLAQLAHSFKIPKHIIYPIKYTKGKSLEIQSDLSFVYFYQPLEKSINFKNSRFGLRFRKDKYADGISKKFASYEEYIDILYHKNDYLITPLEVIVEKGHDYDLFAFQKLFYGRFFCSTKFADFLKKEKIKGFTLTESNINLSFES